MTTTSVTTDVTSESLFDLFWQHSQEGCSDRKSPYHLLAFSYASPEGVSSCYVVLRHADKKKQTLTFHSDIRHQKINTIRNNPQVAGLLYNPDTKVQWRIQGHASIEHQNETTLTTWEQMQDISKICYVSDLPPGNPVSSASTGFTPLQWQNRRILAKNPETYNNFSQIHICINRLEYLHLSCAGQRRHVWQKLDKEWSGHWVNP